MARFDLFVMFAEMRTGSNLLEANLNAIPGLACHGEAFNPHFLGYPDTPALLGVTMAQRQEDPGRLIATIRAQAQVLGGFRFFNDHDPRVLDLVLPDPRCAKIILTRNPVESYVSRKIAAATGQWKLTNAKHARSEVVRFDPAEFEDHLERLQQFQIRLHHALQTTGQTAFHLDYEDVQDLEVMNGLAAFLGVEGRLDQPDRRLKKQNPEPLEEKVANFAEMEQALARLDRFNLTRTPNFEPRRGPGIPGFVAAARTPLLHLPVKGGPEAAVSDWLTALDVAEPLRDFTHKSLRQWKGARPGHRSFAVIRHPLARAHATFCDRILGTGPGSYLEIRETLRRHHGLALPDGTPGADWTDADHSAAFGAFLAFLKANLSARTGVRVDPAWASQAAVVQGMAGFALPDHILREEELPAALPALAAQVGHKGAPPPASDSDPHAARLSRILSPDLESLARDAYARDYMTFGFGAWAPPHG
ncbi:MAG: nodulation protein NodH [Rubellimicrobium sp.]|nr:nodulation protein NodH [Rubellimicrobium sp.]